MKLTTQEILSIHELGAESCAEILEKRILELQQESFQNGKNYQKKIYNNRKNLINNILKYWKVLLALFLVYILWFSATNESRLEQKELKACVIGDYQGCVNGWARVTDIPLEDPYRAFSYEEAYYHSTGKKLFANQELKDNILKTLSQKN